MRKSFLKLIIFFGIIILFFVSLIVLPNLNRVYAWYDCGSAGGCNSGGDCNKDQECVNECTGGAKCCCTKESPDPTPTPIPPTPKPPTPIPPTPKPPTPEPGCSTCTDWSFHGGCGDYDCGDCDKEKYCTAGAPSWCTECEWVSSCCPPEPPTPAPVPCSGCCYFDAPAAGATLIAGNTYELRGWAYFNAGPAGAGKMYAVDIHRCDQGTWNNCQYIGPATYGGSRPDTVGHCGNTSNPNTGWNYNWTVPSTLTGNYTLRAAAINDPGITCVVWSEKNVSVVCPTPAAPSNITASPTCDQGIRFTWQDNSNNEEGFKILGTYFWEVLAEVPPNTTSWYYNWCADHDPHNYNVWSYNACGNGYGPGITNITCPACPITPTPTRTPTPIPTRTPTPAPLPDLIVENLFTSPSSPVVGDKVKFYGWVRNQGGVAAGSTSYTHFQLDVGNNGSWDWIPGDQLTGALAPGESEREGVGDWTAVAGTHKFEVCADWAAWVPGQVAESNEGNNCTSKTFTVSAAPTPACPGCPSAVALSDILRGDGRYNKFIQWLDVAGEDSYEIYRCATAMGVYCDPGTTRITILEANVTSYTDTNGGYGYPPGVSLYYEVRPRRSGCAALNCPDDRNDTPTAATPTPTPTRTPTPTPTPAVACPVCPGWVVLTDVLRGDGRYNKLIQWEDVANEGGYRIYRCRFPECLLNPSEMIYDSPIPNVTSYTDTNSGSGFAPGASVSYEVRALAEGCVSPSCTVYRNDFPAAVTPTPTPACPGCPSAVGLDDILRGDGRYDKFVQWLDVANEEGYRIYRCTGIGCTPSTLVTTVGPSAPGEIPSYRDNNGGAGFAPGTTLMYEVRPFRTGCAVLNCTDYRNDFPAAATPTPTPGMGTVSGYIFVDLNKNRLKDGGETCFDGQAWIWVDSVKKPIFTSTPGCNTYSYQVQKGMSHSIWIYPIPSGYISTGWSGTDTTGNIAGSGASATFTESEINFGFTSEAEPWFQTRGGDVHAQGTIDDPIPSTATDGPYFSLTGNGGYPGVVSYGGSLGPKPFGKGSASQDPFGWLANTTAKETSYTYFEALISQVAPPNTFDPTTIRMADLMNFNGFYKVGGNGNLTLPNGVSVLNINKPNQKVVILVPGNLIIQSRRVNLGDSNNFLAFIVQGNIIIDPNVKDSGGNPALEGVYIADGTIRTGTKGDPNPDDPLTGEGMFIAGNFDFQRDYRGVANATTPAERFIFRPDLWMNAPRELWGTPFTWQEMAP